MIGSLDVKALYPSVDIDATGEIVIEMFVESEFQVEGIDYSELGLYLAINLTRSELNERKIAQFCPTRKHKTGAPKITGCAISENKTKRFAPWEPPSNTPNEQDKRKMLAVALNIAVKVIMKNHIYSFDGKMRRQSKGGPIGLDLTGDLAQIFMMWWERKYLEKLEQLDIRVPLYTRYVDDIIMMAFTVNIMKRITLNEDETPDNQSMEFLKTTGNKIHKSIELEHESRSMHEDNKIPVLDINYG